MGIKINFNAGLNGVRVEAGYNDRLIGVQTDQTILQEKDLEAAESKLQQAKTAIEEKASEAKNWLASKLPKGKKDAAPPATVVPTPAT